MSKSLQKSASPENVDTSCAVQSSMHQHSMENLTMQQARVFTDIKAPAGADDRKDGSIL